MAKSIQSRLDRRIVELWAKIADSRGWADASTKWNDLLTPFELKPPMPGYIGKSYFNQDFRIAVLGINPGRGRNNLDRDKPLLDAVRSLAEASSRESFKLLMAEYRKHLPKWGVYSAIGFPQRFNLKLSQIMVSNVLPASTEVGGSRSELDPLFEFAISKFTSEQMTLLQPDAVLFIGSHAEQMLHTYWQNWPSSLETKCIVHPSHVNYAKNPRDRENRRRRLISEVNLAANWIEGLRAVPAQGS